MRSVAFIAMPCAVLLWWLGSTGRAAPKPRPSDNSAELKLLQGKWQAVDCIWEGKLRMGRRLVRDKLQLHATGTTWVLNGGPGIEIDKYRYSVVLDRTQTPHYIDLQWVDDSDKPVVMKVLEVPNEGNSAAIRTHVAPHSKGIYECGDRSLKVAFGPPGDPRPTTFDGSKLAEGQTLIVFERPEE